MAEEKPIVDCALVKSVCASVTITSRPLLSERRLTANGCTLLDAQDAPSQAPSQISAGICQPAPVAGRCAAEIPEPRLRRHPESLSSPPPALVQSNLTSPSPPLTPLLR